MCRRNELWGWVLFSFGLGLMVGQSLESGFFTFIFMVGLMIGGLGMCKRK